MAEPKKDNPILTAIAKPEADEVQRYLVDRMKEYDAYNKRLPSERGTQVLRGPGYEPEYHGDNLRLTGDAAIANQAGWKQAQEALVNHMQASAQQQQAAGFQTRANADARKIGFELDPGPQGGQQFAREMAAINNTQNPGTDPVLGPKIGGELPAALQVARHLGLQVPPPTLDEFYQLHELQGGGLLAEGDPLRKSVVQQYPRESEARSKGVNIGVAERVGGIVHPLGMLGWLAAERRKKEARHRRAMGVGVGGPVTAGSRPGVLNQGGQ